MCASHQSIILITAEAFVDVVRNDMVFQAIYLIFGTCCRGSIEKGLGMLFTILFFNNIPIFFVWSFGRVGKI